MKKKDQAPPVPTDRCPTCGAENGAPCVSTVLKTPRSVHPKRDFWAFAAAAERQRILKERRS